LFQIFASKQNVPPSEFYSGSYWCMATNNYFTKVSDPINVVVKSVEKQEVVREAAPEEEMEDMYQLSQCLSAMNVNRRFLFGTKFEVPRACNNAVTFCSSIQLSEQTD
jgi:hypothetical protein